MYLNFKKVVIFSQLIQIQQKTFKEYHLSIIRGDLFNFKTIHEHNQNWCVTCIALYTICVTICVVKTVLVYIGVDLQIHTRHIPEHCRRVSLHCS